MEHAPSLRPRIPLQLRGAQAGFRLSPIEWLILAAMLAGGLAAGYFAYANVTDLNAAPPTSTTAYIPAFKSNLSSTTSTTGTVQATQQVNLTFGSSGEIKEINVKVGDQVTTGQKLAKLDDAQLQSALRSAQSNLASAQARLNAVLSPSAADLASAQQSVLNAQNQVTLAEKSLNDLRAKPTASDIATAQQGVLQAQNAVQSAKDAKEKAQRAVKNAEDDLDEARDREDNACPSDPPTACDQAKQAVKSAERALNEAEIAANSANLDRAIESAQLGLQVALQKQTDTLAGATAAEIAQAENSLNAAKAALLTAEERYNELLHPNQEDILPLQASVASAADALQTAQKNLDKATITAPFDGTIAAVNGTVGGTAVGSSASSASASSAVVTLLNPKLIRIDANVDQSDVSKLKVGQSASVIFDALTGNFYRATVSAIGLTPTTSSGVVTYVVSFAIDTSFLPPTTPVPAPGMTAQITVTTGSATNTLVVPARSVRGTGAFATVTVRGVNGDETRRVTTGITNGTLTEIVSGLEEGEEVLYTLSTTTTTPTGFSGFTFPPVGGFGGTR
jgi:HlyD family secretion protein